MSTSIYSLRDETGLTRYIGKTSRSLRDRLTSHLSDARRGGTSPRAKWMRSMMEMGLCPRMDLIEMANGDGREEERRVVIQLRAAGWPLLNATSGGEGNPFRRGVVLSEEHRRQIAEMNKSRAWTEDQRRRIAESNRRRKTPREQMEKMWTASVLARKGKPASEATLAAIEVSANKRRGKPLSPEHRAKIGSAHKGRKRPSFSAEWRAKISAAQKGRKMSPEAKAKFVAIGHKFLPGHQPSDETKAKQREANLGRKLTPEHREKFVKAGAASRRGKSISEENKEKMKQGHKAYVERKRNGQ